MEVRKRRRFFGFLGVFKVGWGRIVGVEKVFRGVNGAGGGFEGFGFFIAETGAETTCVVLMGRVLLAHKIILPEYFQLDPI